MASSSSAPLLKVTDSISFWRHFRGEGQEEYKGGQVSGRHDYLQKKRGHECFNFLRAPDDGFYGYIPPIGKNYSSPQPKEKRNWLVVFVAAENGNGPLTVVGWYKDAVFEKKYQNRPEYKQDFGFESDEDGRKYVYCVYSKNGFLIPVGDRSVTVPGKHFGSAPIVYVKQGTPSDQEGWRKDFVKLAKQVIKSETSEKHKTQVPHLTFPDQEHRKKVEDASMSKAKSYMEGNGYSVADISKEKRGYDLRAIKKKSNSNEELHIEVKGTSNSKPHFFISRNEKLYMPDPRWRLLIVTDALIKTSKISLLTNKEVNKKFKFCELAWEATIK